MAAVTTLTTDRRLQSRQMTTNSKWSARALLRPGVLVTLVNIGNGGALLESREWLRPGARTELQLETRWAETLGIRRRLTVRGRLDRCHVAALDPLRYRGVIVFEDPLERDALETGSG